MSNNNQAAYIPDLPKSEARDRNQSNGYQYLYSELPSTDSYSYQTALIDPWEDDTTPEHIDAGRELLERAWRILSRKIDEHATPRQKEVIQVILDSQDQTQTALAKELGINQSGLVKFFHPVHKNGLARSLRIKLSNDPEIIQTIENLNNHFGSNSFSLNVPPINDKEYDKSNTLLQAFASIAAKRFYKQKRCTKAKYEYAKLLRKLSRDPSPLFDPGYVASLSSQSRFPAPTPYATPTPQNPLESKLEP